MFVFFVQACKLSSQCWNEITTFFQNELTEDVSGQSESISAKRDWQTKTRTNVKPRGITVKGVHFWNNLEIEMKLRYYME